MTFFRKRRGGRWGEAAAILIGVSLLGLLAFGLKKKPRLSAGQQINVLRMRIAQTARNIKEAHDLKILDDVGYTRAQEKVVSAAKRFNTLVRGYKTYGRIDRATQQQVVAILAAAIQITKEVARDGKDPEGPQ